MALTPEQLQVIPEGFITLYQRFENFVIEDIARRINKAGNITDMAKWQVIKAKEFGVLQSKLEKELDILIDESETLLKELFYQVGELSINQDNSIFIKAGVGQIDLESNDTLKKIIKAATKQTDGELFNLTGSLGFAQTIGGRVVYKPVAKYYQDAMDLAILQISSGTLDYNTAIRQAIKSITNSGLRYINYESGWSNRVDVAVRRAIMTGSNQMSQQLTLESMRQLGAEFVETTAHIGARPDHAEWQGKVFSYKGRSKEYPEFEEATGYGTGDGLGGWNCRHSFFPFFPGISERAYDDKRLEDLKNKTVEYDGEVMSYYDATQKQRKMEQAIRQVRRELIAYNEVGLKEDFKIKSIALKRLENRYKDFSNSVGIYTEKERLQVFGFNKSLSQKAVWASKNSNKSTFA